ncbi:MAG: YcxB family protein [Anaerolineae bacterium]|nr:YcxB family protein [Anaerolineae bacterium]
MEPLELSLELERKDFTRIIRWNLLRLRPLLVGSLLMAFAMVVWYIALTTVAENHPEVIGAFYCCPTILMFPAVLYWIILPITIGIRSKKMHDKEAPITWILDEEHLQISSASTEVKHKWSKFKRVIETKTDYCFLSTGKQAVQFMPKSCFESVEQEQRFRHIIETGVGAIKQKGIKRPAQGDEIL